MKRALALLILLVTVISTTSYSTDTKELFDLDSIKSYQDIPGITQEEISAIESLKVTRKSLSYGHLTETEAFILPDGTYAGFTTKFCELLSNLFDIRFVQEFCEWDDLKSKLDNKLIDFTGDLTPTPERMQVYYMTHAIADRSFRIFLNTEDFADILFETDINGLKVGFLKGSIDADSLVKSYPTLIYQTIDCVSFADAAQKLKTHEIDVFVTEGIVDPAFDEYDFIRSKEFFPLVFTPVSLTTANPDLAPIISVVNKYLIAGGIDKLFELYKQGDDEYANYKLNKSFTDEERVYINDLKARNAKVRVALEHDNYPISFYNSSEKEFQGISIDVIKEINRLTGIEFETATNESTTWAQILEELKTGGVSMVSQLLYSDVRKNDFLWTDVPYCSTHYALLSKIDYPNLSSYQVLRARVGTIKKSAHEDMYNEWFPNNANTVSYDTQNEGLDALEKGEVDLLMASEYMLLTQTNYREKPGFKANILFNAPMDSKFGFNKNEEILCSIINKTQLYINTEAIASGWTSRVFDYSKKLAQERNYYLVIFIGILFCVLILIIVILFNNKRLSKNLAKLVKARTYELERQTTTLSTIYKSIPDLVFCKDLNGRYTSCNPSFEKFTGHTEAEITGKRDTEIFKIDEKMAAQFEQDDKGILNSHETKAIEEVITYPDGTQYTVETAKMPILSSTGECVGLLGISRDITHRKKIEETLKLTLDNLDTCIYINEIETGKILFMNEKMAKEFGGQEFNGKVCWEVLQDGFKEQCGFCPIPKLLESGDDYYVWEEHNTVTGKYYKNTDSLIKWQDGKLVHMQHSVDITDSVMMQRELENTVSKLETVVKNYAGIIWNVDIDRKITLFNGVLVNRIGVDPKTVIGQAVQDVLADMPDYILNIENTFCAGPQSWLFEVGGIILNSNTIPLINAKGETIGVVGASYDVTESVKLQQDLEQASKAKSDFLSRMSHEIRTPMNAIIGMTKIADGSNDIDKIKYCLSTINASSEHLLGLINDILDMSKIEAGKFELDNDYFNIEKMLMKICNLIIDKTEQKKQTLNISIGPKMHLNYLGDELRLSQVITNLLSNAVKFTPEEGKITLTVDEVDAKGDYITLRFSISDTGIGMTPEQIKRLFSVFEQADGSISRRYGGTGLGLAISKNIIEKMGGGIWVVSEAGEGSTFIFDIKLECSAQHKSGIIFDGIAASDLKLLVVDDSRDIREQLLEILNKFQIYSDEAESGEEAISLIEKAYTNKKPYDVIFLDSDMPEMNGIETVKRLSGKIDKNTIIIMMCFSETHEFESLAKSIGIHRFMTKSLMFPSTIINMINDVIGNTIKTLDIKTSVPKETFDFSNVSILLVEDVEINREIFIALMEETEIKIDVAENGLQAVSVFRTNPDKYDMIIMDVQMPEMDGYEATRTIRSLDVQNAKTIPIIAMTANAFKEDIDRCIASGMNDHVSKPIDVEKVMEKIMHYRKK